jgi:hypothetical protein
MLITSAPLSAAQRMPLAIQLSQPGPVSPSTFTGMIFTP